MAKKLYIANTDEEMRMVFDPYRLRIIYTVQSSKEPLTVKQIAAILNEPANKVHYHVKKLYDFGMFKIVKTENINGIIAKYYEAVYADIAFGQGARELEQFPAILMNLTQLVDTLGNQFKQDILAYSKLEKEDGKHPGGGTDLNRIQLYMTHEELVEVVTSVNKIIAPYLEENEDKNSYAWVSMWARIK